MAWREASFWFMIVCTAVSSLPLCLYYRRRHITIIRLRMPLTTLLVISCLNLQIVMRFLSLLGHATCFAYDIVENYTGTIALVGMSLRAGSHLWAYRISKAKLALTARIPKTKGRDDHRIVPDGDHRIVPDDDHVAKQFLGEISPSDRFYLDKHWLLSTKVAVLFWVINGAIITVYTAVDVWLNELDRSSCAPNPSSLVRYQQVWYAMWLAIFTFVVARLRHCVDNFGVKWELVTALEISMAIAILWVIPPVVAFQNTYPVLSAVFWFLIELWNVLFIFVPLCLSYSKRPGHDDGALPSLEQLLETPDAIAPLACFFESEFCVESLFFLLAVRKLRATDARKPPLARTRQSLIQVLGAGIRNPLGEVEVTIEMRNQALAEANDIFATYFREASPFMVNVSSSTRSLITERLQNGDVDGTCFDPAYTEVKAMIEQDAYLRFLRSEYGQQLLKS